jgi:hypothetical protein
MTNLRIGTEYVDSTNPLPVSVATSDIAYDGYETKTVSTTAVVLTEGVYQNNTRALITVEVGSVRFRLDGTAPTTSVGHLLSTGDQLVLDSADQIQKVQFISAAGGTLGCSYGR